MPSRVIEECIARWSPSGGGERPHHQRGLAEPGDRLSAQRKTDHFKR